MYVYYENIKTIFSFMSLGAKQTVSEHSHFKCLSNGLKDKYQNRKQCAQSFLKAPIIWWKVVCIIEVWEKNCK